MPVMKPLRSLRKRTPSSTEDVSASAATPGVAGAGQIEHGHDVVGAAAVVKLQLSAVIGFPAASWAPDTVAVYVVDAASEAPGVSIAVRLAASYSVEAATVALVAALRSANEIVLLCTSSLNVALTVVDV